MRTLPVCEGRSLGLACAANAASAAPASGSWVGWVRVVGSADAIDDPEAWQKVRRKVDTFTGTATRRLLTEPPRTFVRRPGDRRRAAALPSSGTMSEAHPDPERPVVAARRRPRAVADGSLPRLARGRARARRSTTTTPPGAGPSRSPGPSGSRSGTTSGSGPRRPRPRAGRRADAGRALVPGRSAQLRRARALDARPGAGRRRRDRPIAVPRARRPHRRRAPRRRRALPGGPAATRRAPRRPRGGVPAQRPGGRDRPARDRVPRRRLVVVCARVRHEGRRRPVRPDRADGPARDRRLPLRRPRRRPVRGRRRDPGGAADPAGHGRRPVPAPRLRTPSTPSRAPMPWSSLLADPAPLAVDAVPFDHPLYVLFSSGTTGLPKPIVHGHGGILLEHLKALASPHGPRARGPVLLVHDDRLDDVELPRVGARGRLDDRAVRWQPRLAGSLDAVAAGGRDAHHVPRPGRPVPDGLPCRRPRAGQGRGPGRAPWRRLHRCAAAGRRLPLGRASTSRTRSRSAR